MRGAQGGLHNLSSLCEAGLHKSSVQLRLQLLILNDLSAEVAAILPGRLTQPVDSNGSGAAKVRAHAS